MSDDKKKEVKLPEGVDAWKIAKNRRASDHFEIHVRVENMDENPLIFEKYTSLYKAEKYTDACAVVLKGIYVGGPDKLDDLIANHYAVRCCIAPVMELMIVEEVEIKKN